MTPRDLISGRILARNTLFNFWGQIIPLLVSIVAVPYIIHGLGTDRYGLLSLVWVVLGYFSIFDLGLGRAVTKFVAESLNKQEENQIPEIIWSTVVIQLIIGSIGALILFAITDILVEKLLNIPVILIKEAKYTFYLLLFFIPALLVHNSFSGVLEAKQRFDLVNAIKIPTSILSTLLTLLGTFLGFSLTRIVFLNITARLFSLFVLIILNFHIFHSLRPFSFNTSIFPKIFSFGKWITISNIIGPFLLYLEKFLIGSILSMSAVAYYTVPFDIINRLGIIPYSLTSTLFPAFSTLEKIGRREKIEFIFARSFKYIFLSVGIAIVIIILFAKDILNIWLGYEFALKSTLLFQILAFGLLVNSLASIPFVLLQGIGRPDLPAKFHMIELPFYFITAWFLIRSYSIVGASVVWTLRVTIDASLLFIATFKILGFSPIKLLLTKEIFFTMLTFLFFTIIIYIIKPLEIFISPFMLYAIYTTFFVLTVWFIWKKILDHLDKKLILKVIKQWKE